MSSPVAVIQGGDRGHAITAALTLDGSPSFHPDFNPATQADAGLTHSWACAAILPSGTTAACRTPASVPFGTGAAATLTLDGGTMRSATEVARYVFTLTVSSTAGDGALRSSTARVSVTPSGVAGPKVSIVEEAGVVYTRNSKVILNSVVSDASSAATYLWTTVAGDVDVSLSQNTLTPNTLTSLSIKQNVLSAGHEYRIRLTVTDGSASGFAEVFFQVKNAPKGQKLHTYIYIYIYIYIYT